MGLDWFGKLLLIAGLVALLIVYRLAKGVARRVRRRQPARLSPTLARYGGSEEVARARQAEAAKIVATSSTDRIVGYEIVEQVEAVYVEGFRRAEEALEGLKAAAAMKGGNAVTNVRSEHTPTGRYAARGDAVIVRKMADHERKRPD